MSNIPFAQGDEPSSGHTLPLLHNVVYCSMAGPDMNEAEVAKIIAISRRKNPEQGITGLLVFGSGIFFQWLEGPRDNVTRLMATIDADRRHNNVVHLSVTDEVRERMFPDWDMELVTGEDIRDVLEDAKDAATDDKSIIVLQQLLAQLDSGQLSAIGKT